MALTKPFESIADLVTRADVNAKVLECLGRSGALSSIENLNELEAAAYAKSLLEHKRSSIKSEQKRDKASRQFAAAMESWREKCDEIAGKNAAKRAKHEERLKDYEEKLAKWKIRAASGKRTGREPQPPILNLLKVPDRPEETQSQDIPAPEKPRIVLSKRERLKAERELLRTYISGHPLDEVKEDNRMGAVPIAQMKEVAIVESQRAGGGRKSRGTSTTLLGIISSIKAINTRSKKLMGKLRIEDKTGSVEVVLFPATWEKYHTSLEDNQIYLIHGKVDITVSSSQEGSGQLNEDGEEIVEEEVHHVSVICNRIERVQIGSDKEWEIKYPLLMGYLRVLPGHQQKSKDLATTIIGRYASKRNNEQ